MFPERLIETETLRPTPEGFAAAVRLPWYRALPLSCVERMDVSVDGRPVAQTDVTLTLGEAGPYTLGQLETLTDSYWYVLDSAQLEVRSEAATAPGSHEISVSFGLYIPYLPVNGKPLVNLDSGTATLEVSSR